MGKTKANIYLLTYRYFVSLFKTFISPLSCKIILCLTPLHLGLVIKDDFLMITPVVRAIIYKQLNLVSCNFHEAKSDSDIDNFLEFALL